MWFVCVCVCVLRDTREHGRIVDTLGRFAVNCLSIFASYLCCAFYDILKAIDSESVGSEVLLVIVG